MNYEYWDKVYSSKAQKYAEYDGWLNKYRPLWLGAKNVIDLGCGCGVNTIFLHGQRVSAIACDCSQTALSLVKAAVPCARTKCFDMAEGLPFEDGFSDLIIADLSLHYFTKEKTLSALRDICRVLSKNGRLLCRVNSYADFTKNENAQENTEGEYHLYSSRKGTKRFFDSDDINEYFKGWELEHSSEVQTNKYGYIKYAWEICAKQGL